jgi:predicted component of viral defense system (DUF524 family)
MSLNSGILTVDLDSYQTGLKLSIYEDAPLSEISKEDALANGESPYQLRESRSYEYELSEPDLILNCPSHKGIVQYSKRKGVSAGRISTGNFVGTLILDVGKYENAVQLEVLATKFDDKPDHSYRKNYRTMLGDITEQCTELLMQANSPITQQFEVDPDLPKLTIYQQFSFIASLVNSEGFEEAILRILSSPKTSWSTEEEEVDIRKVKRFSRSNVRQLATRNNRTATQVKSALYQAGIKSVPSRISSIRKIEEYDNAENRFIKHALTTYLRFFEDCSAIFHTKSSFIKEKRDANAVIQQLESYLQHPFFYDISRPQTLSIGSPVLQRKSGYRFVLRTWLMSELASKLTWQGGDDVYSAGKKDIATLYEYWVFFRLYDLLKNKFELGDATETKEGISSLLKPSEDKLHLSLKQGKFIALNGTYKKGARHLRIKFSYNRSFSGDTKYKTNTRGSWTNTMRPDYTISLWPEELEEEDAEKEEQLVHIHFDAKYKVDQFRIDVSSEEEHLDEIKNQERAGKYKNADILKMHAYKDAIRRTGGAYILYPGTEKLERRGFHEIIPGLGAFALNPNDNDKNQQELSKFLDSVIDHLLDRSSQREHIAVKRYEIHRDKKDSVVNETMPEYLIDGKKLVPDEVSVIIGYIQSKEQLDWIEKEGFYNVRTGVTKGAKQLNTKGAIYLTSEFAGANYILLRTSKDIYLTRMMTIKYKEDGQKKRYLGPQIVSRKELLELGYPPENNPQKELAKADTNYLLYEIEETPKKLFSNHSWDHRKLEDQLSHRDAPSAYAVKLSELMKTVVK